MLHTVAQSISQTMTTLHQHSIRRRMQLVGRRSLNAIEAAGIVVGDVIKVGLGVRHMGFMRLIGLMRLMRLIGLMGLMRLMGLIGLM